MFGGRNEIDLSICIVNWNAAMFLLDCLESIWDGALALRFEVIVVDNASDDDSVAQVRARYPGTKLVLHRQNEGFAVANNIAMANSAGRYILLLNPDTLVYAGALEEMVAYMDAHPDVGACGCRLIHPDSGEVEVSGRSFPTLLPLLWNLSYVDRLFPHSPFFSAYQMTYRKGIEPHEVDWVTGACLLARRETISEIGFLDENIFMYCEDVDWCYRFKAAGWRVVYLPKPCVGHYRGQSSSLRRTRSETQLGVWGAQQYARSILYFYYKHYSSSHTLLLRFIISITAVMKAGLWLVGGSVRHGWSTGASRARSYLFMIPVATSYRPV